MKDIEFWIDEVYYNREEYKNITFIFESTNGVNIFNILRNEC